MDRVSSPEARLEVEARRGAPDLDALPSRRMARASLRAALRGGRGPFVLIGDPGVGKSTLWRSLQAERRPEDRWVAVEAGPAAGLDGFYRLLARELGANAHRFGRVELLEILAERASTGDRVTLVVEEAHNLDAALLEEVRILAGRIGRDDGFAAILVVGLPELGRMLARHEARAFVSRLSGRVHLKALDVDEVAVMLRLIDAHRAWPENVVDRIHLESAGKPGRVVELALRLFGETAVEPRTEESIEISAPPLVGADRPPIRDEEGLIEVGWDADLDEDPETLEDDATAIYDVPATREIGEGQLVVGPTGSPSGLDPTPSSQPEPINDRYAALQAWREWKANQDRQPAAPVEPPEMSTRRSPGDRSAFVATRDDSPGDVWADDQHGFAPYGRLFHRPGGDRETD